MSGTQTAALPAFVCETYLIGWVYYYVGFLRVEGPCVGKGTYQLAAHTPRAFSSICTDVHLFHFLLIHIPVLPCLARLRVSGQGLTKVYFKAEGV